MELNDKTIHQKKKNILVYIRKIQNILKKFLRFANLKLFVISKNAARYF